MSKSKKSKLDQFSEALLQMDDEKKTIEEMQTWLREEGVVVSTGRISQFLASLRQSRLEDRLLTQIATGAKQCEAVEKQFGKNPAPEMDTLIKLHRVLILQLSTQGTVNPELLKLADQLMRTAMEFVSSQTRAKQKERELNQNDRRIAVMEKKAAAYDKAKEVVESKLSPEQQRLALKEILK